jgi:murein DD-endopeptidase MepM/ murein hydrolase activator NlpD
VTYVFPVQGYPKGKIALHWNVSPNAADLFAKNGTPIRAMVDGTISDASWNDVGGWSYYMIGNPDTKSLHYYGAHLRDKPLVSSGQKVKAGQLLGYVGDTGNAKGRGAHLHIGIGTDIKNGSGPEGGAGVPWPGNNCNKYLQFILDTIGSGPVGDQPPPPPPINYEVVARYLTSADGPILISLRDRKAALLREANEIQNTINELERNRPA